MMMMMMMMIMMMMMSSKRCGLHVVGTSVRLHPLPQIATTAVSTETAPALTRKTCKSQLQKVPQNRFWFASHGRIPWVLWVPSLSEDDLAAAGGGAGSLARIQSWRWVVYTHMMMMMMIIKLPVHWLWRSWLN